jgi:hypothetical protein
MFSQVRVHVDLTLGTINLRGQMYRAMLAALLSATPVLAQEAPTPIAAPPVSLVDEFEHPGNVDRYTIRLNTGDHAIGGDFSFGTARLILRRAGNTLASITIGATETRGTQFRVREAGQHTIEVAT